MFSAIRVGGAAGRVADERRALAHGVLGQETVGAGGLAYGLRTLPVALELARTVAELAPRAWLINFTNPAGLITEASRAVLGDRVIGICDSPVGLIRRVCRALGVAETELATGRVVPDYVGINHLGWLRALRRDGEDLLPDLLGSDAAIESFEEGRLFGAPLMRALAAVPNEYLHYYYSTAEVLAALATGPDQGRVPAGRAAGLLRRGGGPAGRGRGAVGGDPAPPGGELPCRGACRAAPRRAGPGRRRLRRGGAGPDAGAVRRAARPADRERGQRRHAARAAGRPGDRGAVPGRLVPAPDRCRWPRCTCTSWA